MENVGYDLVNLLAKIEIQLTRPESCVRSFKIDLHTIRPKCLKLLRLFGTYCV